MANWTEPLPKHTKLDYHECYAKVVLEELYPNVFVDLEIKDKPDLQMEDGNCGIEVTSAIDRDQLMAESLYVDILYNRTRNAIKAREKIEECGCKLNEWCLQGKPGTDSFSFILLAFDKKLKLLNDNRYRIFNKNYLFIFSDIYADEKMIIEAIEEMKLRQKNKDRKFCNVFILVPGYCYNLDLNIGDFAINRIESNFHQANKAREIVEKYEKL